MSERPDLDAIRERATVWPMQAQVDITALLDEIAATTLRGTFACPRCGRGYPHTHPVDPRQPDPLMVRDVEGRWPVGWEQPDWNVIYNIVLQAQDDEGISAGKAVELIRQAVLSRRSGDADPATQESE